MYAFKNSEETARWYIDLTDHTAVENRLPMSSITIRNDHNKKVSVYLGSAFVGEIQRYSSDTFTGLNFSSAIIKTTGGSLIPVDAILVQVSKNSTMSAQPFNPQWDTMEEDMDNFLPGTTDRVSLYGEFTLDLISYLLNSNAGLIVQRRLTLGGSAVVGEAVIEYSNGIENLIKTIIPIDGVVEAPLRVKKTVVFDEFVITLADCEILGLMVDFLNRENKITAAMLVVGYADILEGTGIGGQEVDTVENAMYGDLIMWVEVGAGSGADILDPGDISCYFRLKVSSAVETVTLRVEKDAGGFVDYESSSEDWEYFHFHEEGYFGDYKFWIMVTGGTGYAWIQDFKKI